TVIAGRFVAPIGWFNERLNTPWINKLPDAPLMFRQVSPADLSLIGLQARGSFYLGCSPVKLEYNAYVSNGLATSAAQPHVTAVANLEGLQDTYKVVTNDKAWGGRLGLWIPACGVAVGFSGLLNGDYTGLAEDDIKLWALDANYHKGNWDLRCEYAQMYQHAATFIGTNIRRRGFYAQAAYRPYDAPCDWLSKFEAVARYSFANFRGIDPHKLDLTAFDTPIDVPVNRNQYTLGLNYYFYPSLVLKLAYEFNDEGKFDLHDDMFTAHLAWGW